MKCTEIRTIIKSILKEAAHFSVSIEALLTEIIQCGGRPLLVGGAVRDILLQLPVKDIDVEVHHLSAEQLEQILKKYGPVDYIGKSFGVFKLHRTNIDWALPRLDSSGRHPHVIVDPDLPIEAAFARRDLTINAMGIDLTTYELIDPFDGQKDLQNRVLRTHDPLFFVQDPLRFFRVMQFLARFEMNPDAQLNAVCKIMDISQVSTERIESEFQKLLLKSRRPSLGIRWLKNIGRLAEVLLEVSNTIGVMQEPAWHPEGDVFEHTMQAIDAAAVQEYIDDAQKLQLMYATLCHDLGKALTTFREGAKLRSPGHSQAGVPLSRLLLKRITRNIHLIETVEKLVDTHMAPGQLVSQNASSAAYKRLAQKLSPHATLQMLALLAFADRNGRNAHSSLPLNNPEPEIDTFLQYATQYHVALAMEKPILLGRDILDLVSPGPRMGQLLQKAYELQIEEGITDKEILKTYIRKEIEQ